MQTFDGVRPTSGHRWQALKAYKAMGIETVLINPNIATIQTSRGLADAVYYMPVNEQFARLVEMSTRHKGYAPRPPQLAYC